MGGQTIAHIIASGIPFVTIVAASTVNKPFPAMTGFSFPKNTYINVITKIVFVRLPTIEPKISPTIELLNSFETIIGVIPISILGRKQIIKLPKLPLNPADSAKGENKNAVGNAGSINVQ